MRVIVYGLFLIWHFVLMFHGMSDIARMPVTKYRWVILLSCVSQPLALCHPLVLSCVSHPHPLVLLGSSTVGACDQAAGVSVFAMCTLLCSLCSHSVFVLHDSVINWQGCKTAFVPNTWIPMGIAMCALFICTLHAAVNVLAFMPLLHGLHCLQSKHFRARCKFAFVLAGWAEFWSAWCAAET